MDSNQDLKDEVEYLYEEIEAVHDQIDRLVRATGWKAPNGDLLSTMGVSVKMRDVVDHVLRKLDE